MFFVCYSTAVHMKMACDSWLSVTVQSRWVRASWRGQDRRRVLIDSLRVCALVHLCLSVYIQCRRCDWSSELLMHMHDASLYEIWHVWEHIWWISWSPPMLFITYSGEKKYLLPCWFWTFAHWQRNYQSIIVMVYLNSERQNNNNKIQKNAFKKVIHLFAF